MNNESFWRVKVHSGPWPFNPTYRIFVRCGSSPFGGVGCRAKANPKGPERSFVLDFGGSVLLDI